MKCGAHGVAQLALGAGMNFDVAMRRLTASASTTGCFEIGFHRRDDEPIVSLVGLNRSAQLASNMAALSSSALRLLSVPNKTASILVAVACVIGSRGYPVQPSPREIAGEHKGLRPIYRQSVAMTAHSITLWTP